MACLAGNAQFESLYLKVFHESLHAVGDGAEIVVVHLLVFCALVSHQCPSGEHQVGASRIESLIDEEILLFPTEVASHLLYFRIEELADFCGSLVNGM